jgi:hypothetical protein
LFLVNRGRKSATSPISNTTRADLSLSNRASSTRPGANGVT